MDSRRLPSHGPEQPEQPPPKDHATRDCTVHPKDCKLKAKAKAKASATDVEDKMLSFAEVARRLGVSGHTVADMVRAAELTAFTPAAGKHRRIWESELARYRQSKAVRYSTRIDRTGALPEDQDARRLSCR
jgi:excisionase family DNA binding protein